MAQYDQQIATLQESINHERNQRIEHIKNLQKWTDKHVYFKIFLSIFYFLFFI